MIHIPSTFVQFTGQRTDGTRSGIEPRGRNPLFLMMVTEY